MVTIREISERCGCSVATVSKALNGMPDIGEATATRVRKCASEMGYMPNSAARTLKTKRSHTVGLLIFLQNDSVWLHSYFGGIAASIQREMEGNHYDIAPIDCMRAAQSGSYLSYCRHRGYDGIILMSAGFTENNLMELVNSDIPLVTIDYAVENRSSVLSNNDNGMRELTRFAYEQGHRRIAMIHGENTSVTRQRLNAFFSVCMELRVPVPDEYVIPAFYHDTGASELATRALLGLQTPPTCIFYPDDFSIIGGMNELRARHMSAPEDISIAGYDGIPLTSIMKPMITTVRQDSEGIGRNAARMLLDAIERPTGFVPQHSVLPSALIKGGTIGRIDACE